MKASSFSAKFSLSGVTLDAGNGVPEKTISHTQFLSGYQHAFKKKLEEENQGEESSLIRYPYGTIGVSHSDKTLNVVMYYSARVAEVIQFQRENIVNIDNVPLPNVLIHVKMNKRRNSKVDGIKYVVENAFFYCTDMQPSSIPDSFIKTRENTKHIWALPMPNMYGSGAMCFGDNSIISNYGDNLSALSSLYDTLLGSPFNSDLSVPSIRRNHTPYEWLRHLSGMEVFPYSDLSNFDEDYHKTVTSFQDIR